MMPGHWFAEGEVTRVHAQGEGLFCLLSEALKAEPIVRVGFRMASAAASDQLGAYPTTASFLEARASLTIAADDWSLIMDEDRPAPRPREKAREPRKRKPILNFMETAKSKIYNMYKSCASSCHSPSASLPPVVAAVALLACMLPFDALVRLDVCRVWEALQYHFQRHSLVS